MVTDSPEQLIRNQVVLREVNERIAEIARSWSGDAPAFLCECSHDGCTQSLALSLPEFERIRSSPNLFMIAPGHESAEVDRVVETRHGSTLVEKTKHLELVLASRRVAPAEGG
jgi:hypothetical protein